MHLNNLKNKLIISFILLSVIPVTIIGIVTYRNSYEAIRLNVSVSSEQILIQTIGKFDYLLRSIENASVHMITSNNIQVLLEDFEESDEEKRNIIKQEVSERLLKLISTRNDIVGVNILLEDVDDVIVAGEKLVDLDNYRNSEQYITAKKANEQLIWIGTRKDKEGLYTNKLFLVRKINSLDKGEDLGVLVIGINEFAIADTYSYIDFGPGGFIFIVDDEGNVISHLNKKKITKPSNYSFMKSVYERPDDRKVFVDTLNQKKVLVCFNKSKVNGWYMISVYPLDYMLSAINEVGVTTLIAGLIILIISIIISKLISTSISNPVEKLVDAMEEAQKGNLHVNVDIRNNNEIGKIGNGFNKMINEIRSLIVKVYEAEISMKDAQINALQLQINPHFLYNTLAVIDGLAQIKGAKKIGHISQALCEIFRYSVKGDKFTTLEEEMKNTQLYLSIHEIRYNDRLKSKICFDEEFKDIKLPKLLIQPIIENAIIHGIEKKKGEVYIYVNVKKYKENVYITVRDNGAGIKKQKLYRINHELVNERITIRKSVNSINKHIGLANINRRIKLLYGEKYGLKVFSKKNVGTKVIIIIPYSKGEEGNENLNS